MRRRPLRRAIFLNRCIMKRNFVRRKENPFRSPTKVVH
ncbi:MAG: hypothetical protein HSCHL_0799 [Hydrogenibacillus schlegelii]|uniref:Uncharacterized protein n=1 Tax=Hydrogenibacillus schlegelii TaxID=1484 RepID=A0A2T5GDA3_HYDSH|nr:MAG: hypothetical protein HSCHL_0799 [Hydrogenibacillus schlegelii]